MNNLTDLYTKFLQNNMDLDTFLRTISIEEKNEIIENLEIFTPLSAKRKAARKIYNTTSQPLIWDHFLIKLEIEEKFK